MRLERYFVFRKRDESTRTVKTIKLMKPGKRTASNEEIDQFGGSRNNYNKNILSL